VRRLGKEKTLKRRRKEKEKGEGKGKPTKPNKANTQKP